MLKRWSIYRSINTNTEFNGLSRQGKVFVCQLNTMRIGPNAILMYYEGG